MTRKLSAGLLIAFALATLTAPGSLATSGGHFASETHHTYLVGTESTGFIGNERHTLQFFVGGGTNKVKCHEASYAGTWTTTTATELTLLAEYENCTYNEKEPAEITMNGCDYLLTVRADKVSTADSTLHLKCPAGSQIQIHTSPCKVSIPAQTLNGVSYSQITLNNKHALTVFVTASGLTNTRHGVCQLLGTHSTDAEISGSLTIHGHDAQAKPVGITATGTS